jgi:hypothetical protein
MPKVSKSKNFTRHSLFSRRSSPNESSSPSSSYEIPFYDIPDKNRFSHVGDIQKFVLEIHEALLREDREFLNHEEEGLEIERGEEDEE